MLACLLLLDWSCVLLGFDGLFGGIVIILIYFVVGLLSVYLILMLWTVLLTICLLGGFA